MSGTVSVNKAAISVSELNRTGHTVVFSPEEAKIIGATRTLHLRRDNGVFYLDARILDANPDPRLLFPIGEEASSSAAPAAAAPVVQPVGDAQPAEDLARLS